MSDIEKVEATLISYTYVNMTYEQKQKSNGINKMALDKWAGKKSFVQPTSLDLHFSYLNSLLVRK